MDTDGDDELRKKSCDGRNYKPSRLSKIRSQLPSIHWMDFYGFGLEALRL